MPGVRLQTDDKEFPYDTQFASREPREKSSSNRPADWVGRGGSAVREERDAGLPPAELKIHMRVSQFSFERPCMRIPERAYQVEARSQAITAVNRTRPLLLSWSGPHSKMLLAKLGRLYGLRFICEQTLINAKIA